MTSIGIRQLLRLATRPAFSAWCINYENATDSDLKCTQLIETASEYATRLTGSRQGLVPGEDKENNDDRYDYGREIQDSDGTCFCRRSFGRISGVGNGRYQSPDAGQQ